MDEFNLDGAIKRLRDKRAGKLPDNIEQNVWRRIHVARVEEERPGLVDLVSKFLFATGWFVPAAALAIVFSAFASSVAISKVDSYHDKVSHALGFESITEAPRIYLDGFKK